MPNGNQTFRIPRDIAERFGVDVSKVLTWINAGELAAVNVATRASDRPSWRIFPDALAEFEAARSSKPKPPTPKSQRKQRQPASVIEFF